MFYCLTFILTTIFIFTFFSIIFHPETNINLGKDDSTLVTVIATVVMIVAMMCVFLANNFYINNKKKDISVMLMSGASVYQIGIYLFVQSMLLIIIAIPIGMIIGYLLMPVLSNLFNDLFISGSNLYITSDALVATASILFFEVIWCTYLNVGYCYRTSVQKLQQNKIDLEIHGIKMKKRSQFFWIILYIIPFILFIINNDTLGYALFACVGIVGVYGLIKHVIPNYINIVERDKALENDKMFIALGFVRYNLQKIFILVLILLISSILLMVFVIHHLAMPLISMLTVVSYASVMILMSITIISKIGMDLQHRKRNYQHLSYLGYTKKSLKSIMQMEMLLFYGILLCIPLLYEIVIVGKLVLNQQITLFLGGSMLLIQILPIIISYIISVLMYHKVLPK
ncbi:MAG: FtsX-like permease family protein [Coprobacillaceae bacterium]